MYDLIYQTGIYDTGKHHPYQLNEKYVNIIYQSYSVDNQEQAYDSVLGQV